MEEQKAFDLSKSLTVLLILLAALTFGEFFIGRYAYHWWAPLMAVALMKAFFVLRDYMHIGKLVSSDEEVH